ncbi:TonB-dependent receptor [Membranihabitans marinus]|uniref:TonB-dependent receptor n=1 Tax=Membranihabitans marinus TaxID=1227546 RepID=UPI001F36D3A9|nr:TonB-dependent receptor [Membranihabitans marinus]
MKYLIFKVNPLDNYGVSLLRNNSFWMKLSFICAFSMVFSLQLVLGSNSHAQGLQDEIIQLEVSNENLSEVFQKIEAQTHYRFAYSPNEVNAYAVSLAQQKLNLEEVLNLVLKQTPFLYKVANNKIIVYRALVERPVVVSALPKTHALQVNRNFKKLELVVSGRVVDQSGESLIGVNVTVKGTDKGTATDFDGNFELAGVNENAILICSYIGYQSQEVPVNGKSNIEIVMVSDAEMLDEIIVVGYGVQNKSDLTGSVVRADIESFREQPNISIMQSLQGSVPGLNIGQVNEAGAEPDMQIRGRTSLSGEQNPLIVLDGVIYRGNISDINPSDIKTVDVLKDASAASIYGSQASNGVIILTTKSGGEVGKPIIRYNNSMTFQSPIKEFATGSPEDYLQKTEWSDIFNSRTQESGYLNPVQGWEPSSNFKTNDEITAYNQGRSDNWYDLLTNDNPYIQNHNLSLANRSEWSNYYISMGLTDQEGYMKNEGYQRLNARVNVETKVNNWLDLGLQSTVAKSNYDGPEVSVGNRYISPFATAYNEAGELIQLTGGLTTNPLIQLESDYLNKRLNLFGNFYANIDLPFIEGLSYKGNYSVNYQNANINYFREYSSNFQGQGSKQIGLTNSWLSDHILTYKRNFNQRHNLFVTLVYGAENRKYDLTQATSSIFANPVLGYNSLQSGSADQQLAITGAWEEASLYQMARINYGFDYKYLFTATVRRDGFSGFGASNKFGIFPSVSLAWVMSEENFVADALPWVNTLKLRLSYGSNGNRTIGRYQTLAQINAGFDYILADGTPVYSQAISKLASPDLKWETTTGFNVGFDFGVLKERLIGSVDYYNNETTDLLYQVDIPGISRFETFPDNLGRIHNQGLDLTITSVNIQKKNFTWETSFVFSRNRNKLVELLGFDNDGDGVEDDLISEGLFIGESIDAIYGYQIDGFWQVGDEIPAYSDLGAYKVVDVNGDGQITPDDRSILGYSSPNFRFSINNSLQYNNWTLRVFVNSIQGGNGYYLGEDNLNAWGIINQENHFNIHFPNDLDFWTPENPNATYQRPNINISSGLAGTQYSPRSFVRLQDVSLSYTFMDQWLEKIKLESLKLFVSGKNLATFTNWRGWDPETGQKITSSGLPVLKGYSLGLNLAF